MDDAGKRRSRGRTAGGAAVLLIAAALAVSATCAMAQQATLEERLREALRRTTVELRALQDQQATERAELTETKRQRDLLQQKVDQQVARISELEPRAAVAAELPAREAELAALRQQLLDVQARNEALQKGLQEWQAGYEDVATVAREKEAERRRLEGTLGRATDTLAVCRDKNDALIKVAQEVLGLYQSEDFLSVWRGSYEPLLGLKKVELENIVQDYQDRVLDQQFFPPQQAPSPAAAGEAKADAGTRQ